ncbi:class I SAM-dependent methyltransferase, partial [bacterium]|nr:class I SAM-dependent methyltransferase [bacterium]
MDIEGLTCPYCAGRLKPWDIEWGDGLFECSCNLWPFLSGILVLKREKATEKAVNLIKKGKARSAAFNLLMKESWSPFFAWAALHRISFYKVMGLWGFRFWTEYTRYRFSASSFLSFLPLVSVLGEKKGNLLDFGCGTGHTAYILSKWIDPKNITLCDKNFANLYLARNFAKDAGFFCLDGNLPLPFKDKSFSSILCSDSFHFVEAKAGLASEFMRVLDDVGAIFLSHLHNRGKENPITGYPLFLQDYLRLFPKMEFRTYTELKLRESLSIGKLNLKDSEDIKNSPAFSLILTRTQEIFKEYETKGMLLENLKNPIINPIYKIKKLKAGYIIKRRTLSKLYRREYPEVEQYIKKAGFIYKKDVANRNEALLQSLILIDAPE